MLKGHTETLKNRPYFGGTKNSRQIRQLNEIKLYINLIKLNVCTGVSRLIYVVTYPFMVGPDWCIYYEEIGGFNRRSHSKRICLSKCSVIPYNNGKWETERCFLKTNASSPKKTHINIRKYQPVFY